MASAAPPTLGHDSVAPPSSSSASVPSFAAVTASTATGGTGMAVVSIAGAGGSPNKGQHQVQQGHSFEPLDKAASQTVKLNPKMELSRMDLLKLLSYMEAELQARDVVIATLKTERVKNLLQYGRVSLNDPFLALQRDNIGGALLGAGSVNEAEMRAMEESQLTQLEQLINQQRKAHQRMRHVLREAEKRHARVVAELEEERRKHEHDTAQGDDVTYALEKDRTRLKQELEAEKAAKKKSEKELRKLQETIEEERGKQKQIILMLVEERKRLAVQYMEERKRSEDLAQILSEEKGRIDNMAEGLEEESKKSLQMEAELEKQLADFDTERQQMKGQLIKKDERTSELESLVEKLQKEVEHYRKQLQEAHNVAMFQQTLSVSPPRIGLAPQPQPRPSPPQLPAKPTTLTQPQAKVPGGHVTAAGGLSGAMVPPGVAALSSVTKAVQLTATVNSVPVAGPTTGIARGVQPGVGLRPVMYSVSSTEHTRTVTTASKTYSVGEGECSTWAAQGEGDATVERGVSRHSTQGDLAMRGQAQVVQVTPRVNVSASPGTKVITTTHGGKVTFHVTTNAPSTTPAAPVEQQPQQQQQQQQQQPPIAQSMTLGKKPVPPVRSSQPSGPPPPIPLNKPVSVPPVPPNKPVVPPKKDLVTRIGAATQGIAVDPSSPISVEVKPQKVGPQTVKFGITISKTAASGSSAGGTSQGVGVSGGGGGGGGPGQAPLGGVQGGGVGGEAVPLEGSLASSRRDAAQVGDGVPTVHAKACVDSLSPELEHFHQLLISMAGSSLIASASTHISAPASPKLPTSAPVSPKLTSSLPSSPLLSPGSPQSHQPSSLPPSFQFSQTNRTSSTTASSSSSLSSLSSSSSTSSTTVTTNSSHCFSSAPTPLLTLHPKQLAHVLPTAGMSHNPQAAISHPTTTTTAISRLPSCVATTTIHTKPSPSSSPPSPPPSAQAFLFPTLDGEEPEPPHSPLDVSTPLTADGMTALHLAAQGNNWQSIPVLVKCGASVVCEDEDGATPAHLALLYGCTPAAAALLAYPQPLEHTTKDGCNYLHAAVKSGEVECVELLIQHILATDNGSNLLHCLAGSSNTVGETPFSLCLQAKSHLLLVELCRAGLDVFALLSRNVELLAKASKACQTFFATSERNDCTCCVWLEGTNFETAKLFSENEDNSKSLKKGNPRWAIGSVRVTPATLWAGLEEILTSMVLHHWDLLSRIWPGSPSGKNDAERRRCDHIEDSKAKPFLGLDKAAISHFAIGPHKWTMGEYGLLSGPYDLLINNGAQSISIFLEPLESIAYTLFLPTSLINNYLRLVKQSQCVVLYGPEQSGKSTIISGLVHLLTKTGDKRSETVVTRLDLSGGRESLVEQVQEAVECGGLVLLERIPRDLWPALWPILKEGRGCILATLDSWRRPGGGLEGGVRWVQLRHDQEPLAGVLSRSLARCMMSLHMGVLPSLGSHTHSALFWAASAWAQLTATLMTLGFSSALHGPHLFLEALYEASNPRDYLKGVEQVWNNAVAPKIRQEVMCVWRRSSVGGELGEARVTSMALYVVIQRSLVPGLPVSGLNAENFLAQLDGGLGRAAFRGLKPPAPPPRPKHLPLGPAISEEEGTVKNEVKVEVLHTHSPVSSPTSPDWDEASLTRILGLAPMGYA